MWPDRVSNPGPLTYESGALPIVLRSPDKKRDHNDSGRVVSSKMSPVILNVLIFFRTLSSGAVL